MKICVLGLGYIGLPTAIMLAIHENEVCGVDINLDIIQMINNGELHIKESGLSDLFEDVVNKGNFKAFSKPKEADAFIIAVPTPIKEDKSFDGSYVIDAVNSLLPYLRKGNIIIIESTIAPRTTEDLIKPLIEECGFNIGKDIYLAHCPERVLPGNIINELINNDRVVGGITKECAVKSADIYKAFVKGEILLTDSKTAEMAKLIENTFRDVNIAFSNEITRVCTELKIDALDVIQMANRHPRVNLLNPGPGVGGHCLAVDPYFIIDKEPKNSRIISIAREINDGMPYFVVENIDKLLKGTANPLIAVLGVSYKGNVDDVRESPAIKVIELLKNKNYKLNIYDPYVKGWSNVSSIKEAILDCDMVLILSDHKQFKKIDAEEIVSLMRSPMIFDTKGIIMKQEIAISNENNTIVNDQKEIKLINWGNLHKYLY
ncbi:nucleotide sugar dehydrogenase [Oceanirhabdus seepicola]|uniref:Nucleotide sugar dehydrogenase n=2 Tax=Oceanirhabdus seepicola TaxID=2828781 RepID=A0A9J6P1K9_9CLOT|nr:nucleotide sugar dehydrogenase [Oceanirhabdus seepicola]